MHEIRDFCVRTNRRKVKTCQQGKTLQRMRLAYMCTVTVTQARLYVCTVTKLNL